MDTLGLYLKEAVQDKGQIFLPGIGTFKKERIPAFFDDVKQRFMPPLQSIILTDQQVTDETLIQFIADKEDIDLEESRLILESFLSEIETKLQEKKEITLGGFGILKKVKDRYEFSHFQSKLEGVFNNYEPIAESQNIIPVEGPASIADPVVNSSQAEATLPIEESVIIEDDIEEENTSRRWLWAVLAIVALGSIAGFWLLNPNFNSENLTKTPETIPDKQAIEQTLTETPAQSTDLSTQAQPSDSLEQAVQNPASEPSESIIKEAQGPFEIIIAAFHTMEEAEAYVNRTNAKGHNVYIIKNNNAGNLNKISYGSFQTAAEADQALAKVREELTKEAWIFKSKNKNQELN